MKGRAREVLWKDFTAHSTARQMIWMPVNKCMRQVFTCGPRLGSPPALLRHPAPPPHPGLGSRRALYPLDVGHVRMVLRWLEEKQDAVQELDATEGCDPHVEEDAKQHSQGDVGQDGPHEDGQACKENQELSAPCTLEDWHQRGPGNETTGATWNPECASF